MRGKRAPIVDKAHLFYLLAEKLFPLETVKQEYVRAVYAKTGTIADTARTLQVDRQLVRKHLP